jgi:hypothetical protein
LTYSERPLAIDEVVDAIAVDTEGDEYFEENHRMPDPGEITCYCSSLVIVVSTKYGFDEYLRSGRLGNEYYSPAKLQLAHFSVKEYLTSGRLDNDIAKGFQRGVATASISIVCLAYLMHSDFQLAPNQLRESFSFVSYCSKYWMTLAAGAEIRDRKLQSFINKFLCYDTSWYWNCYSIYRPDQA